MLPIYLAAQGYDPTMAGIVFSCGAFGGLIGFILIPLACHYFKSSVAALLCDLFQFLTFSVLVVALYIGPRSLPLYYWSAIQFLLNMFEAIWFGSSETLTTRISDQSTAQSAHKWNYFAGSMGPALGPALAGLMYQLGGMLSIAAANAISFAGQIFTLVSLSHVETVPPEHNRISVIRKFAGGIRDIWVDRRLRYLTALPIFVKVYLLGAMPFVIFQVSKQSYAPFLIGLLLGSFAIGNAFGALTYRSCSLSELPVRYRRDATLLLLSGVTLNALLFMYPSPPALAFNCLLSGIFVAKYSIELRALRQSIVSGTSMATVVASQGFLARVATPASGVMFGFLLSNPIGVWQVLSLGVFALGGLIGVVGTYRSFLRHRVSSIDLQAV